MASQENTVRVVLIIGLILLVILIIITIITFVQNRSALAQAGQNLEDAITNITSAFTQFSGTVFSGLSRFVAKLRDFLASFINKASQALASSITFLSNTFNQIFRYLEHLANQVLSFFAVLYFKIEAIVITFMSNLVGKMITIPVNIGLEIGLAFTELIASGIHTAYCFAKTGLSDFADLLEEKVFDPLVNFFTNPNNPVIVTLKNFFNTNLVNPINKLISSVAGLGPDIKNFFNAAIQPFVNLANGIKDVICAICKPIPGISCGFC